MSLRLWRFSREPPKDTLAEFEKWLQNVTQGTDIGQLSIHQILQATDCIKTI